MVSRTAAKDADAFVPVAERFHAAHIHADVVSLNEGAGKRALEADAAVAIAGNHVARGNGRASEKNVVSAQAHTLIIANCFGAGDIYTDEVSLNHEIRAGKR